MKAIFLYSARFHESAASDFWKRLREANEPSIEQPLLIVSSKIQKQWIHDLLTENNQPLVMEIKTLEELLPSGPDKQFAMAAKQVLMAKKIERPENGIAKGVVNWQVQKVKNQAFYQPQLSSTKMGQTELFNTEKEVPDRYAEMEDYFLENPEEICKTLAAYVQGRSLYICGFWRMNLFEEQLLKTAIEASSHTTIHLIVQDHSELYAPALLIKAKLVEWGKVREFPAESKTATRPALSQIACRSFEEELAQLCETLHQHHQNGTAWKDILIVVPDQKKYLWPILKRFEDEKIPCRRTLPKTLKTHPIWPQLKSILEAVYQPSKSHLNAFLGLTKSQTNALSNLRDWIAQFPEQTSPQHWQTLFQKSADSSKLPPKIRPENRAQSEAFWQFLTEAHQRFHHPVAFSTFSAWVKRACEQWLTLENEVLAQGYTVLETALTHLEELLGDDLIPFGRSMDYLALFAGYLKREDEDIDSTQAHLSGVWIVQKAESVLLQKPFIFVMGASTQFWPSFPPMPMAAPSHSDYLKWDRFVFFALAYQAQTAVTFSYTEEAGSGPSFFCKALARYRSEPMPVIPATPLPESTYEETLYAPVPYSPPDKDFVWSASTFEDFQACPQQFFFKHVARLSTETEVHDDVSAKEWGIVVHELLSKFFLELKKQGRSLSENTNLSDFKPLLISLALPLLDHYADDRFAWKLKRDWLLGTDQKLGLIDHFLSTESQFLTQLKRPFFPSEVEAKFEEVALHHPDESKTLTFKGTIDLYLEDLDHKRVLVLDYKTGKSIPAKADITSFKHLQLPLYQLALKSKFPEKIQAGGLIYQLHHQHLFTKKIVMLDEDEKKETFDVGQNRPFETSPEYYGDLIRHLFKIDDLFKQGFFSPDSHDIFPQMKESREMRCQNCAYRWACRYEKRFDKTV